MVTVFAPDSTSSVDSTGIDPGIDTTGGNPGFDTIITGGDTTDVGIRHIFMPDVLLTPNPTRGTVTVASNVHLMCIEVYDLQGRRLRTITTSADEATIDLSSLPPDVYTLSIHTDIGILTRKVTVVR